MVFMLNLKLAHMATSNDNIYSVECLIYVMQITSLLNLVMQYSCAHLPEVVTQTQI